MIQFILYNQLNTHYLYDDCLYFVFIYSHKKPNSPYGPLTLTPHSQKLEYACSQQFINELIAQWKQAQRLEADSWYTWIKWVCEDLWVNTVVMMYPNESTTATTIIKIQKKLLKEWITLTLRENTQFFISHEHFKKQFPKPPVMETFYRRIRKSTGILMDWERPLWWKRNYDKENRKFDKNWRPSQNNPLHYPTSRQEALILLDDFITHHLDRFGELEDAMYQEDDSVHHSLLSTAINFWLLTPQEVVARVENTDTAVNNKEWFIRQILWRREYMYHRFWHYKDTLYQSNTLNNTKILPLRFWRPEESPLRMNCVNHVLQTVKNTWYSHHITRLMIIGNFCLLMGYNPHYVNKRFWEMYTDAFERVVTPNVLGMSQFADWWNLATKPYISSANYINTMSNYCKKCFYDPKVKTWEKACPMNYLYWNFIDQHRELFKRQPYIVKNLDKIDIDQMRLQAKAFIDSIV
jgi:deoxyribodipyrimidine photolyase-related protein